MTDRELLELIAAQVGKLTSDMDTGFTNVYKKMAELKNDINKTNMTMEHDIQPKIAALYDGQKQINDRLDRIEKEVSKHDEIIWKRVK